MHDFADLGGGLCLGGYETAACPYLMQELGITHILRIMKSTRTRPTHFKSYSYMSLDIGDEEKESEKLGAAFGKAFAFISQGVAGNGKVYVHCAAGISRSPCVCLAYLMKERGLSLEEARTLVKQVRPQVCPNAGFEEQLRKLETELRASSQSPQSGWTLGGWLSGWLPGPRKAVQPKNA
ncbi:Putative dual specificity phosphatase [Klebsormidium nitens]|uniref:protein-tyrosine-phosphatase n=1 Tax=Klebsormidium nitens TaxID=105231 RepID=A0A1Y1I7K7_KLENI|nr:Putative dual specificity phosphatase [Klebsormidium nitens]|eukprot:GAQ85912.1 Putative dual specificity phosphatase [Klebsormidium nitens]